MRTTTGLAVVVIAALSLISACCIGRAQGNSATLTGTVTDSAGSVIPKASVVVTDEASGVSRVTTSDGDGFFSFVGVPVGTYDVKVSAAGFNSMLRNGVAVHIDDQIELKGISLGVAAANESVTVTATGEEMTPTTSGEVSYTLTDTQIQNMDIESRSAIELLGLLPGAGNTGNFTQSQYNTGQAGFTQNASTYTVNGNRFDQVQIESEGATVTDLNTAGAVAVTPNVDMISELKVESAAYSAAEPNGPVVVSTETKSGGRDFHGEGYLTARNYNLNATDWQQKSVGLAKAQSSLYYPGVNIGGPVLWPGVSRDHEKLFFFAALEIAQQHVNQGVRKAAVPAVSGSPGYTGSGMANGDFTDSAYISSLSSASNSYLFWPVGSQPCSGSYYSAACANQVYGSDSWGQIQKSAIDPAGQILLSAFPHPNVNPVDEGGYNLITDFVTSDPRNQESLKMDYAINEKTHLSGRYNHENESVPWPYGPYNVWNQVPYPAYQTGKDASNSLSLVLTNTFGATLTNEAALTGTRFTLREALSNLNAVSTSALNYPYAFLFKNASGLIPNVQFEGGNTEIANDQLYIAGGEAPPFLSAQNSYTLNDALTKLLGRHMLKAGFYAEIGRFNNLTTGNDNGSVSMQTYCGLSGNDWADLLLGYTCEWAQSSSNIMANMEANRFDFFAQDTWKAGSRLTLNYGLRVDHIGWWYDRGGRIAIFNPAAYVASATPSYTSYTGIESNATTPSVPRSGSKPLGFEWAPQVGFAYDLFGSGKTIVRGGFGTSYYDDPGINAYSAIEAPPNFKVVQQYTTSSAYTLSSISAIPYTSYVPTIWGTADPNDHRAPVTYSWNFALSHVFPWSTKIEANYVGNSSHNLVGYGIVNAVPEGSEPGPYYGTYYDDYATPYLRPYPDYGNIDEHFHNLNSNYNALQLMATRQKGWLNYWGSYTFGKTLAYNAEDSFDMKRWYGPAPFDRSQIVSFSYYLKLPALAKHMGANKLASGAFDGWQFSGIFQAMTGGPISNNFGSEYAANRNTFGIYGTVPMTEFGYPDNISVSGAYADGTPDEVAVPLLLCNPSKGLKSGQYFNANCFGAPGHLQNGTYRLPYIHGPAFINDSTGIFKSFPIREGRSLEIRGEAFNLFNHPWNEFIASDSAMYIGYETIPSGTGSSYPAAGTLPSTPNAGVVDNKTGHREIQLAAKYFF
jgi:Carboxypeptidase regulatory-like domain